jgi:hypothetical protein
MAPLAFKYLEMLYITAWFSKLEEKSKEVAGLGLKIDDSGPGLGYRCYYRSKIHIEYIELFP